MYIFFFVFVLARMSDDSDESVSFFLFINPIEPCMALYFVVDWNP